jgi:cytochrome c biogenesis protein CcdA
MINEPRTYRHSPAQFILVMVTLVILGFVILTTLTGVDYKLLIFFAIILGIGLVSTLSTMMQKTIISEDGISTQTILGEKSLHWGEVSRVSGRGQNIKLHNFDGDVKVVPSSQLPGYEEVVEWIGIKRPDLFSPQEYEEMKRGWQSLTVLVAFLVLTVSVFTAGGVIYFSESGTTPVAFMPLLMIIFIALVFFGMTLFQVQSLTLEGRSLRVKYLFKENTLLADEIAAVDLRYSQNKNGKNYFVQLTQTNKKKIKISGLNPSLPIVYLTLKNWHKKNAEIGLTTQRN